MARSNTGGTRGFLRGKVANDLYQVGHRADGTKVQLVRSVEESRINNNTMPQAMARMQMALCMGSLAQYKEIVDHSFEGVPYGQLSIAHFVHLNIPAIQDDCKNHWSDYFLWDYPIKGTPEPKAGSWIMSQGSLTIPNFITRHSTSYYGKNSGILLNFGQANLTKGRMKEILSLADKDYMTHLAFAEGSVSRYSRLVYFRLYLNPDFPDNEIITPQNYTQVFTYDGNCEWRSSFDAAAGTFWYYIDTDDLEQVDAFTVSCNIMSRWNGVVWQRNTARFLPVPGFEDYKANWTSPHDRFQSWFPEYDPDASDDYPLPREDWVDLGLPSGTLWARCNIGAVVPQGQGLYFSWANIQGHYWNGSAFADGYQFSEAEYQESPGYLWQTDIDDAHDAAREYLGEHWKIPSGANFRELISNTSYSKILNGSIRCLRFLSINNGNFIDIPYTGYSNDGQLIGNNTGFRFPISSYDSSINQITYRLNSQNIFSVSHLPRYYGFNYRPIYIP